MAGHGAALRAAQFAPERIRARRLEAERRLRVSRGKLGFLRLRWQPYIWMGSGDYQCVTGEALLVQVDEAVDVWELLADTVRFWRAWRPSRRRTDASTASARRAFELWERASSELKP